MSDEFNGTSKPTWPSLSDRLVSTLHPVASPIAISSAVETKSSSRLPVTGLVAQLARIKGVMNPKMLLKVIKYHLKIPNVLLSSGICDQR